MSGAESKKAMESFHSFEEQERLEADYEDAGKHISLQVARADKLETKIKKQEQRYHELFEKWEKLEAENQRLREVAEMVLAEANEYMSPELVRAAQQALGADDE
jgi:hypothetical protein